jgi:TnpA family transposase
MNDTGRRIREQYVDTGGFTDQVFATCSLLGHRFVPRIRNLPSKKFYVFDKKSAPKAVRPLIAANIKEELIERQWPDVVRLIASIVTQRVVPSQMLRTLSSFSRQNELAFALREIGRIERTIFILQWIRNTDLQRRAQIGLNKGEAHHALKRALNFNRNGEIRDRATENQHYRMLGLNLLTAIVIYWNTKHLGKLMKEMEEQGKDVTPELKSHVSPLGWEHIILAEYLWKNP